MNLSASDAVPARQPVRTMFSQLDAKAQKMRKCDGCIIESLVRDAFLNEDDAVFCRDSLFPRGYVQQVFARTDRPVHGEISSSFLSGTLRSPGSEVNGCTMKEIELSSLHPLVTLLLREDLRHRCLLRPMKVSFASSLRTTRHDSTCRPGRPFFRAARHAASVSAANASASTRHSP